MNRLRAYPSIVLAAVLLLVGHVLTVPLSVSASSSTPPPTVPGDIAVPAGFQLLFSNHAKGFQVYECLDGQWTLHAPAALLFATPAPKATGIHYGGIDRGYTPGPWWESLRDGSRIRGGNALRAPSPNPNSIPLLRLEVLDWYGTGVFSPVKYIHRLNTVGGVSPTGACMAGAREFVPYTADYYFYGNS